MNMRRRPEALDLDPYVILLQQWVPKVEVRPTRTNLAQFDCTITLRTRGGPVRYFAELKPHLRHQDVQVVAERLHRMRAGLKNKVAEDRVLLLAPHVRAQQAKVLEGVDIDYLDLAGNAHLKAPGLWVHVEGRQPQKAVHPPPQRPHKAWIKLVMAILVQPELTAAPYRRLAEQADVALGTVAKAMTDLAARGLLVKKKDHREVVDRPALVAVWVQAYVEALRPRLKERHFEAKAPTKQQLWDRIQHALGNRGTNWALTGADAAERHTRYFRAPETELYAPVAAFDRQVQKALVAQPAGRGGNLVVIEPPGPLAVPAAGTDGPPVAPPLLVYAELRYRGTEQATEAAQLLLPQILDVAP